MGVGEGEGGGADCDLPVWVCSYVLLQNFELVELYLRCPPLYLLV